jgi:hypothetical protein
MSQAWKTDHKIPTVPRLKAFQLRQRLLFRDVEDS